MTGAGGGGSGLRRWWRTLWPSGPAPDAPPQAARSAGDPVEDSDAPRRPAAVRRYDTTPAPDDPQREAHLGAVLQALAGGPLSRGALGERVDAGQWGPGRLDAVVAHGVAAGVLVADDDGTVRARYAD